MTNRRRGGHVDPPVVVSVIKRFEFLFESVRSNVQVAKHMHSATHDNYGSMSVTIVRSI